MIWPVISEIEKNTNKEQFYILQKSKNAFRCGHAMGEAEARDMKMHHTKIF